jgi:ABC-2 type transport system ATP-binding protein
MIQARGITRRYGRFTAVRNLDLDVPERIVCGLLGPNGAGKTTTIRMITGMLPPDAGELRVVGRRMPEERRAALARIGYLPESAPSHPEMRVGEYLRFRGRLLGLDRSAIERGIGSALDACDLRDVERRLVGQLSKGYRQRVGLAAALLGDPALLVLDEPTVGLDPRQLRDFRTLVRRLAEERTVLLSSHIMQEIEAVADRVVLMHRGRKLADDTVAAFRDRAGGRTHGRVEVGSGGIARIAEVFAGLALSAPAATLDDRGHACFRVDGPDHTEMLGRAFAKAGLAVLELHHEQAGLESVFLDLLDREAAAEVAS